MRPQIAMFGANTKALSNSSASFPLLILNSWIWPIISCFPMLLDHSFSTDLHSLFLIWVGIWKTSVLIFNYILHFCSYS